MHRYIIDIDFSQNNFIRYIETFTQEYYPRFFLHDTTHGLRLGYGEKATTYSEFLDIVIDKKNKSVVIERDLKATLILFYYVHQARLIISSDYNYFAEQLPLRDMFHMDYLKLLLGNGKTARGSICTHIDILYPRKKYTFHEHSFRIDEIPYAAKSISRDDMLMQNFCHLGKDNIVGAEISGGKDSAFLPVLSKKSSHFPFTLVTGQLHTGEVGEQQWATLEKVINYLDIPHAYHSITEDDYPFKNDPIGVITHPVEEIYKSSVLGEIDILKNHGINTVFTGFGGDEAFEDSNDPQTQFIPQDDTHLASIFQDSFIEDVHKLNESAYIYTDGMFQTSLYDALLARNNLYIHQGIWPITPFLNCDIYTYFQSLQVSKKQFFRSFYNNFDTSLVDVFETNTNMGPYFRSFFRSDYFNNTLHACLEQPSIISSFYKTQSIKKRFANTSLCSDQEIDEYGFFMYKFIKISLMIK